MSDWADTIKTAIAWAGFAACVFAIAQCEARTNEAEQRATECRCR